MGCSSCKSSSCSGGCSSSSYCNDSQVCPEDHCQKVYESAFYYAVCPTNSWNVPLVGQTAVLTIKGLKGMATGSWLWHEQYGYFQVNSVSVKQGTISITNQGTEGNSSPGTQIPECTCFVVTVPPAEDSGSSNVCVAVSFTAPAEGVPTDITLTSTFGIAAGQTIEIGSGFYFVQEVKPDNIITIVNTGDGVVPGTAVLAQDASGNYINCLSVIAENPCTREVVEEGAILACNGDDLVGPLDPLTLDSSVLEDDTDTLSFSNPTLTGTTTAATIVIANTSPTRPLQAIVTYITSYFFNLVGTGGGGGLACIITYDMERQFDGAGYVSLMPLTQQETLTATIAGNEPHCHQIVATSVHTVAAGVTLTIDARAKLTGSSVNPVFATSTTRLQMKAITVSL